MAKSKSGIPPTVGNFVAVMNSLLTQFDAKLASRERHVNIYRLGHYLEAANRVTEKLDAAGVREDEVMTPEIADVFSDALSGSFEGDFPPTKKLVKQISDYLSLGKNPSLIAK